LLKDVALRFLLVFLSIETILEETTIYRRREKLGAIESGLDLGGAYKATLGRIRAQGGEKTRLGMAVLMWISHSRRSLQADEICHALAVRIGSKDINSDNIPAIPTLLSCCQGLVTMDKGTSTVRLIHYTLQEYLCTHPDLFNRAHSTVAETCLTYLNFQSIKDLSADSSPDPRDTPFLKYASLYWGTHLRMELSDHAKTLALELLDRFDSHISANSLWHSVSWEFSPGCTPDCKPFSALHCISYFGITEVANILIKTNRWDLNQRDGVGMTPLTWAARHGHEEMVGLLLREKHIQPDQQDVSYGRTALSWAAGNGHEGVVRLFLCSQFANPRSIGGWWGKAVRAVSLPFDGRYVNPDSPSKYGRTPLSSAAGNGHEGIVKLLLGRKDVNPDSPSKYGRTPLSWAARDGHEGIVKVLLGRKDVNPNTTETLYRQTPLSCAAENGHEGIVKLLLEREDVSPDSPSKYGRTPLSLAARGGHEGIVKLLLGRKDVDPDSSGRYGRTPLSCAAGNGYEGVVELLLGREDVNPDSSTKSGRTPLAWAAENGHERVVKLLLGRQDVNPDSSCNSGRTPLSWAAENGCEGVVKLLLNQEGVNPDSSSKYGRTPLSLAARNGHEGIVELLLSLEGVNPTSSSKSGQTPLTLAAENGHDRVVKLLQSQHSRSIR